MTELLDLQSGDVFADAYRIVRPLRSGGMGRLYVVIQLATNKLRVLKLLADALVRREESRTRFLREARAAAAIESDHVVDVVTAGVDSMTNAPYIVMELLDGQDLCELVEEGGPVPFEDVRLILTHVGHALERAHALGIVHRDLKPENVFLAHPRRAQERFTTKVLDFGVAKLLGESTAAEGTQPVGSPLFMAPEQTDPHGRIAPQTDVWALGLLAYYLLTGTYYWTSASQDVAVPVLLREVCFDELPPASARAQDSLAPRLPNGFDAWFARCVSRDIDHRYNEGGEAVRAFLRDVTASDEPGPAQEIAERTPISGREPTVRVSSSPPEPSAAAPAEAEPFYFWEAEATPSEPPLEVPDVLAGGLFEPHADDVLDDDTSDEPAATPELFLSSMPSAVPPTVEAAADVRTPEPAPSSRPPQRQSRPSDGTPIAPQTIPVPSKQPARGLAALLPSMFIAAGIAIGLGSGIAIGMRPHKVEVEPSEVAAAARHRASAPTESEGALPVEGGCPRDMIAADASGACIDRVEVSVAAYAACEDDGVCPALGSEASPAGRPEVRRARAELCNGPPGRLDHPANCVSFEAASTFCAWNDRRLPSASEWTSAWALRGKRAAGTSDDPRANLCRWGRRVRRHVAGRRVQATGAQAPRVRSRRQRLRVGDVGAGGEQGAR